jgi:hypothetical protein
VFAAQEGDTDLVPPQNLATRLEAVAVGLSQLAEAFEEVLGQPTPNLLYWRDELFDIAKELTTGPHSSLPEVDPQLGSGS